MNSKYDVRIFWTGGLDSTFRVMQLSRMPVRIIPYYIQDVTIRKSTKYELDAIKKITEMLKADSRTKAEITPLEIIEHNDPRTKDREVILAQRRLYTRILKSIENKHGKLPLVGSIDHFLSDSALSNLQYVPMASFAKNIGHQFEIGIIYSDSVNRSEYLEFIKKEDPITGSYLITAENSPDKDYYMLWKNFRCPLAAEGLEKIDEIRLFKEYGYVEVMNATWFCHRPIDDKPCGHCLICIRTIRNGISWRFSDEALERYHAYEKSHKF